MSNGLFEQIIQELEISNQPIRLSDVVMFSEPLRSTLNFALETKRFNLTDLTEQLKFTRDESRRIAALLIERGFLDVQASPYEEEPEYETQLSG
jgi:hypothetical protein